MSDMFDTALLKTITLLGIPATDLALNIYNTFKKENVQEYFRQIKSAQEKGVDFSCIKSERALQRYFLRIMDDAATETDRRKIRVWKNVIANLAAKGSRLDMTENYLRTVRQLTVFDLVVLNKAYTLEDLPYTKDYGVEAELTGHFDDYGIDTSEVMHSVKWLASLNLLEAQADKGSLGELKDFTPSLDRFYFTPNDFGIKFLQFVSSQTVENETDEWDWGKMQVEA